MKAKEGKFSAILRHRKDESTQEEPQTQGAEIAKPARGGEEVTPRMRGRPKANGKRLNPDYTQVTAYIPTDLHTETKINLIRTGKREFSILIAELLAAWNKKHGASGQNA